MKPYYEESGIVIYHADCRDVMPLLPKVDAVVTDPPFGSSYASHPVVGKGKSKSNHQKQTWDSQRFDKPETIIAAGDNAIIWGGNYYALPPSRGWLVWFKRDSPPSLADCELAWTSFDMNAAVFDWPIAATNAERIGHPTQKPLALMRWCLGFLPNAKVILDPFMGSGTTLVAAKPLGRKAIGIEMEEKYCEIAVNRLRQSVLEFPPEPTRAGRGRCGGIAERRHHRTPGIARCAHRQRVTRSRGISRSGFERDYWASSKVEIKNIV